MRLVEIVIADVLSKNNKKYFQMIFESLWVISVAVERKVWFKYQKQYHIFECVFFIQTDYRFKIFCLNVDWCFKNKDKKYAVKCIF